MTEYMSHKRLLEIYGPVRPLILPPKNVNLPSPSFRRGPFSHIQPKLADLTISAATSIVVSTGAKVNRDHKAGASVTGGQIVYLDANGDWELAQCDGTALESGVGTTLGMCLHAAGDGQELAVQTQGIVQGGFTAVVAAVYVVSDTAGALMPVADLSTTGWYLTLFGFGATATTINLGIKTATGITVPA